MKHLLTTLLACAAPFICTMAQTDNPRGIYKMTMMVDKMGTKMPAPYEQYKICTDSVTLMATIQGNGFRIINNDKRVLNYTGEEPDANNATATRIFNSDDRHFTLKWWSGTDKHLFFPHNSWCTEYYESNTFSNEGKIIFDALQSKVPSIDKKSPLYGHWHVIGLYDELPDVKAAIKQNKDINKPFSGYDIIILTDKHFIYTGGQFTQSSSDGKKYFTTTSNGKSITYRIYWFSDDCIAIEKKRNQFTDYELWKRVTDDVTPLSRIASRNIK